jgi:hypothetical protein
LTRERFRSDRPTEDDADAAGWPGARITVRSSPGAAAGALPKKLREDGAGSGRSNSGAGIVGARNWAGAVVAHSRSAWLSGLGGGGIRLAVADSVVPQLLQKFALSRFSVLQTGQIEAMAYLLTTLGIENKNLLRMRPADLGSGFAGTEDASASQVTATRLVRCAMRLAITAPSAIAISSAMFG